MIHSYLGYFPAINRNELLKKYNILSESSESFAEWNKPIPKGYTQNDDIYTTLGNDKIIEMENIFMFAKDYKGGKGRKEGVAIK